MNRLRLIPFSIQSAAFNMAADELILSTPGTTLRFYGWNRPALSFGRNNANLEEIDLDVCKAKEIELVRRITGGKTVLHQHELTYSICSDISLFSSSILKTYRMISQPLSESLRAFGVKAEISPKQSRKGKTTICFQEVSAYEIAVNKRKIVGSAQFRKVNRFLQHGSILLDLDWELWKKVWKLPLESTLLEKRITTFFQQTGQQLELERFTGTFASKLAEDLKMDCYIEGLTPDEESQIIKLTENYLWNDNGN